MVIKKASVILGIVLAGFLQSQELAAQSQSKAADGSQTKTAMTGQGGKVLLHETFESHKIDRSPDVSSLERDEQVTVVDGEGKVGSGQVAHFNDSDDEIGALEYNLGDSELGGMYIEFDAMNNAPTKGDKSSAVIFGVGPWTEGQALVLSSKAQRAFGLELYQQKNLKLRVGDNVVAAMKYDAAKPCNVKIWVNDNDENAMSYKRPDNGEAASLGADSVVAWVNNALIGDLKATGNPMHREITEGAAVIGRVGFSSASTKVADFLFDNLHVEDLTAMAKPAATTPAASTEGSSTKAEGSSTKAEGSGAKAEGSIRKATEAEIVDE